MLLRGRKVSSCCCISSLKTFSLSSSCLLLIKFGWNSVIIPHFLSNLHHIKVLESWAIFDTELEITLLVCDWISVKSKLCQLVSILDRLDIIKLLNSIVGKEDSLKSWAVIQTLNRLNQVSSEVHFCKRNKTIKTLNMGDQVISQVQNSKFTQMADIFNLGQLVRMKIKDIKFGKVLEVSDSLNIVLTQHEHSQGWNCVQMRDLLDIIVV